MNKLAVNRIGFEVLEDTGTEIILKRVLKQRTKKSRYDEEMALPKLSVQYFEEEELKRLQEIAMELSVIINKRKKEELSYWSKILKFLRIK